MDSSDRRYSPQEFAALHDAAKARAAAARDRGDRRLLGGAVAGVLRRGPRPGRAGACRLGVLRPG